MSYSPTQPQTAKFSCLITRNLIKLRKDLKDAIEKARSLENDNEEKEIFSSRTLAEIESLKQNKEALENRI